MQELRVRTSACKVGMCLLAAVVVLALGRIYTARHGGPRYQKDAELADMSNAKTMKSLQASYSLVEDREKSSSNSWSSHEDHKFHLLSPEQVKGVERFVFFTGYPRSGHSIIGSLLDAHPNIVMSYNFLLFRHLIKKPSEEGNIEGLLQNKTLFFNDIYNHSYQYSLSASRKKSKGYTLDVPGLWSGTFDSSGLKVIGDKSAMPTTIAYLESSESWFKQQYDHLGESVGVPLAGIHVVRNPFDMIATHTMYTAFRHSWKKVNVNQWTIKEEFNDKETWSPKIKQFKNESLLGEMVNFFLEKASAAHEMVPLCDMNVLEVHNEDFVMDPRRELQRLCTFLNVECSERYLAACESKTFKKISRTRDLVYWPPHLKAKVEDSIKKYPFFRGYTFEDDFYSVENKINGNVAFF